jgi:hypothetical protein
MIAQAVFRAALTGTCVFAVLWLLRRGGLRLSGLLAALPVLSAPALMWMCMDHGAAYAAPACTAALFATALSAFFSLAYGRLAAHCRPLQALALAATATGMATWAASSVQTLGSTLLLAVLMLPLARTLLGAKAGRATPGPLNWRGDMGLTVGAAALISGLQALAAPWLDPRSSGLLAALPVVSASSALLIHARHGAVSARSFLRGYVEGLAAKCAFLAVLSALLTRLPAVAAWGLALTAALLLLKWPPSMRALGSGAAHGWRRFFSAAVVAGLAWVALPSSAGVDPSTQMLFEQALNSLRAGRSAEAYGRFSLLADYGHVEAARYALWLYEQGPSRFGSQWDCTTEQLEAWAALAGRTRAPTLDHLAAPTPRRR